MNPTTPILRRAPGKLFWFGEYVVLDGAPAIVSAVDRWVTVRSTSTGGSLALRSELWPDVWRPDHDPAPKAAGLCRAALETLAEAGHPAPRGEWSIESASLGAASKYGLGSSGAVAAALTTAWAPPHVSPEALSTLAHATHDRFQGGVGSGADVSASLHGGLLALYPGRRVVPLPLPTLTADVLYVFTGRSADTRTLVRQWRAWRDAQPETAAPLVDALKALATQGLKALEAEDRDAWCTAVTAWSTHCRAVGASGGPRIVTEEVDTALRILERSGYAAKASGAGGGDVVLGFPRSNAQPQAAQHALKAAGLTLLDLSIAPTGALTAR